jgi:glycerol uptake facilitator-like aquaporin
MTSLTRRAVAEFIGTAMLLATVIGSGIMAQALSPDDVGLQLLQNALSTGFVLAVIILFLGPVSGAHLNPVVSLAERLFGGMDSRTLGAYVVAQVSGGAVGVVLANVMFDLPAISIATTTRSSPGLVISEIVATFGLVALIFGMVRAGSQAHIPYAVGGYIAGAYFFTASTSFANPAVTLVRTLSDTFAGIRPVDVGPYVVAQLVGMGIAVVTIAYLYPQRTHDAGEVVVPHPTDGGVEESR